MTYDPVKFCELALMVIVAVAVIWLNIWFYFGRTPLEIAETKRQEQDESNLWP